MIHFPYIAAIFLHQLCMGRNYNDLTLAEALPRWYFFITISNLHYAASELTGLIWQSLAAGHVDFRQNAAEDRD